MKQKAELSNMKYFLLLTFFHFIVLGRRLTGLYSLYSAECIDNHPTDRGM